MKRIIIRCPNRQCGATLTVTEKQKEKPHICPVCNGESLFRITNIDPVIGHIPRSYYKPPKGWDTK